MEKFKTREQEQEIQNAEAEKEKQKQKEREKQHIKLKQHTVEVKTKVVDKIMMNLEDEFPEAVNTSKSMAISFNPKLKLHNYMDRKKVKNEIAKFVDPNFDPKEAAIQMQNWQKEILEFVNRNYLSRKDKDNNITDNDTGEGAAESAQCTKDAR